MAKLVEVCMFCSSSPCSCNKPAPKKKAPLPKVEPKVVTETSLPVAPVVPKREARVGLSAVKKIESAPPKKPEILTLKQMFPDIVIEAPDDANIPEAQRIITMLTVAGFFDPATIEKCKDNFDISPVEVDIILWKRKRTQWTPPPRRPPTTRSASM